MYYGKESTRTRTGFVSGSLTRFAAVFCHLVLVTGGSTICPDESGAGFAVEGYAIAVCTCVWMSGGAGRGDVTITGLTTRCPDGRLGRRAPVARRFIAFAPNFPFFSPHIFYFIVIIRRNFITILPRASLG